MSSRNTKQDQKSDIVAVKSTSKLSEKPWSLLGKRKIAGVVHDGGIDPNLKLSGEVLTMIFHIHHFASRSCETVIRTEPVEAHGQEWVLTIRPRVVDESTKLGSLEFVGVFLGLADKGPSKRVRANVAFHIGPYHKSFVHTFTAGRGTGVKQAILVGSLEVMHCFSNVDCIANHPLKQIASSSSSLSLSLSLLFPLRQTIAF